MVGEIGERVMRDRERLAQDGFVVAYVPVNKKNKLVGEPRIISRGFLRMDSSTGLMDAAQKELKRALKHNGSFPDDTSAGDLAELLLPANAFPAGGAAEYCAHLIGRCSTFRLERSWT
ncbi:MAG: hypothetical protein M5U34_25910 [Chloroflexi bacterium]|nr:hypothetical protein [Chloroflexota bacterium]